jgi:hypothetical protein
VAHSNSLTLRNPLETSLLSGTVVLGTIPLKLRVVVRNTLINSIFVKYIHTFRVGRNELCDESLVEYHDIQETQDDYDFM